MAWNGPRKRNCGRVSWSNDPAADASPLSSRPTTCGSEPTRFAIPSQQQRRLLRAGLPAHCHHNPVPGPPQPQAAAYGSVRRNSHARFRRATGRERPANSSRIADRRRKASQPDRRVGGNVGAPADDIADTIARHTHGLRQGIRRQAEGLHVLSARISPGCVRKRGMTLSFNGYPGSRRDPGRPRSTRSKRANDH